MNKGYDFYFKDGSEVLTFPITPSELSISIGSNNKTITLINEGEINILKSPSLTEIKFDARFPMRQYPYARKFIKFSTYWDKFKELKEQKKSFRFIVARTTPEGSKTWDTNILVALEDIKIKESSDEGDDVIISFALKQFKPYGVRTITPEVKTKRDDDNKTKNSQTYTVKTGDTLIGIARKCYGSDSKWKEIYNANKTVIENAAKKHGKKSSSNGHWIYAGTKLIIPAL